MLENFSQPHILGVMFKTLQNKSHAVMSQRSEPRTSLDNFPTPPWATRALLEQILCHYTHSAQVCLEPACGAGHMSKVLSEYFSKVVSADVYPYGFGEESDFLTALPRNQNIDWVITNPPFRQAEKFIQKALKEASCGVAMLTRTVFLESIGRYENLFKSNPPSIVGQFCERVPMVKGRLDAKATTATGYSWIIWEIKEQKTTTQLKWIKPCRKSLEREGDYVETYSSQAIELEIM